MANVQICDKCGKRIDRYSALLGTIYRSNLFGCDYNTYTINYDLCKDCTKDLEEFIKGKDDDA